MPSPGRLGLYVCIVFSLHACADEVVEESSLSGAVRVGQVLGGGDNDAHFSRARAVREFDFPADHGAHSSFKTEWWYLTANLADEEGHEFGVQFTLFRHALSPAQTGLSRWQTGQVYMAHVAVTDVDSRLHLHDQRLSRGHAGLAGVEIDPSFRAYLEDWTLAGQVADRMALTLNVKSRDFEVDLDLEQTQDFLFQGDRGLSAKGPGQASYYYSIPSMRSSGKVIVDGQVNHVRGKAWLDREWSTSVLNEAQVGWDWFALHFDDGAEATLFNLRREDCSRDPFNQALRLDPDNRRTDYGAQAFSIRPISFWKDGSGTDWPVTWTLEFPEDSFELRALVQDQVMDTGIRYWEGAVGIYREGERVGSGYMELTGYEGDAKCGV